MNPARIPVSRRACLITLASSLALPSAFAQSGVDRLLVPAPAGGASDAIARNVGEAIRKTTGQTVLVDNRPGAGGILALDALLAAPRDGHAFLLSPNSLVTENPYSYKFPIDPLTKLVPLAELASVALVLVTHPQLPVRTVAEMIAYVKAHPKKATFASYSPGSASHIMGLRLNKAAGIEMDHVGYKGSPPALQDLLGGHVQFMFDGMGTSLPMIRDGRLRALAVTSAKRSPYLPDVPTLAEIGYADLVQTIGTSVWSTPDVPAQRRNQFRDVLLKAISAPEVRKALEVQGMEPGDPAQTAEALDKRLRLENERIGEILRSINYKP